MNSRRALHMPLAARFMCWQLLLLFWLAVAITAYIRGGAAEWLTSAVLGLLIGFAMLAPRVAIGKLDIERVVKPVPWNGREQSAAIVELSFKLKRGAFVLPFVWMHVEEQLSNESSLKKHSRSYSRFMMPWFCHTWTIRYVTANLPRGNYHYEAVSLTTGDLFGLSRHQWTVACEGRIVALPSPPRLQAGASLFLEVSTQGGRSTYKHQAVESLKQSKLRRPGRGLETRIYQPGDSLRYMDWRSAAKGREYRIRLSPLREDGELILVLDNTAESYDGRDQLFDECAALTLEIAKRYHASGVRIWLLGVAGWLQIESGDNRGIQQAAEQLAKARMSSTDTPAVMIERVLNQLPIRGGSLLLITANWHSKSVWRRASEQAAFAAIRMELGIAIEQKSLSAAMQETRRKLEVSGIKVNWIQLEEGADKQSVPVGRGLDYA